MQIKSLFLTDWAPLEERKEPVIKKSGPGLAMTALKSGKDVSDTGQSWQLQTVKVCSQREDLNGKKQDRTESLFGSLNTSRFTSLNTVRNLQFVEEEMDDERPWTYVLLASSVESVNR